MFAERGRTMKKNLISSVLIVSAVAVCTSCGVSDKSIFTESVTEIEQRNIKSAESTLITDEAASDEDLVSYSGENIIDKTDFDVFEEYFYGVWYDETETAPRNVELTYSGNMFDMGFYELLDIYTDSDRAYLAVTVVGETTIYAVNINSPETMYEYCETNHGGKPRDLPDFTYTRKSVDEDDCLGFFGILKLCYADGEWKSGDFGYSVSD